MFFHNLFWVHVSIMFRRCPQNLWDFHQCSNVVGQVQPTKANWPPHWDHGKKPQSSFKLPINILNMYKHHFPTTLNRGPKVQIYKFWGLIWLFKWVLGVFTAFPMWGSIHPGRFTQGPINHALPATWVLAQRLNNAPGEISEQQETNHALAATWALAERLNNAPGEIS
jgi:hypothetical protein